MSRSRKRVALARRFEAHRFERIRPDGTVLEVRGYPMPDWRVCDDVYPHHGT